MITGLGLFQRPTGQVIRRDFMAGHGGKIYQLTEQLSTPQFSQLSSLSLYE